MALSKSIAKIAMSDLLALFALPMIVLATFPGVLIGSDEAFAFVVRACVCFFVALLALGFIQRGDRRSYESFFVGVIFVAVLNSLVVITTAIIPDVYEALNIRKFSGFDKHVRAFRSPGLFRGFDTSGYFMIFAILSVPVALRSKRYSNLIKTTIMFSLIVGVLLSSRSSMLILSVLLFITPFVYGRALTFTQRALCFAVSFCVGLVGLVLISAIFDLALPISWTILVQELIPVEIDEIYGVTQAEYYQHYSFSSFTIVPDRTSFLPDNFYLRSAISSGVLSMFAITIHIIYLLGGSILCYRGMYRWFAILISLVFFVANLKNNYMLFLPFYMIIITIFACRPKWGWGGNSDFKV
tara:strand:- start:6016 stop:7080 length:1065 start_codon:yes stop_codon:yes gene_type:complete